MSWSEVYKINKNMKRAINEQITDREFNIGQIITSNRTWSAPKTGIYKIICVGKGADGDTYYGGASGGVVVEKAMLTAFTSYSISFTNGNAKFGTLCEATAANNDTAGSGTTTNGIVYPGKAGYYTGATGKHRGADVGLFDIRYMSKEDAFYPAASLVAGGDGLFGGKTDTILVPSVFASTTTIVVGSGGYGAGGGSYSNGDYLAAADGGAACVYIELVEEN